MFKKIALGLIMALGITLGVAAPAQADPLWYQNCSDDNICFYQQLVTGNEFFVVALGHDDPGQCYNFYDSDPEVNYEDTITAWANYWNFYPLVDLKFYVDRDCDDSSGASMWTNQATGEFWGGIAVLGISSVETRYHT